MTNIKIRSILNSMINDEIRNKLFSLAEQKYKEFSAALTPGEQTIIGVRIPVLKAMAKEIAAGDYKEFLKAPYTDYHEECMIYGLVTGYIKTDLAEALLYFDKWLSCVKNWAVCDTSVMNFKIMGKKQNQSAAWEYILNRLKNTDKPFIIRAMLVSLFCYFNTHEYADRVKDIFASVENDHYYVKMAIGWGVCELLIKNYETGLSLIKSKKLEKWTHNKAIQKAVESFRITDERKAELKECKM